MDICIVVYVLHVDVYYCNKKKISGPGSWPYFDIFFCGKLRFGFTILQKKKTVNFYVHAGFKPDSEGIVSVL